MMRILQVSDSYYPDPGGVSEVLFHLSGSLKKLGHDVEILTSRNPDADYEDGVKRVGWRFSLQANKSEVICTISPKLPLEVRDFIQKNKFDIIHTHGPFGPNLPFLALLYSNAVNVATFHTAFTNFNYYKIVKFLFSGIARKIDGSICVSEKALNEIQPHFPYGNYRIIPNGVDTSRFTEEGERLKDLEGYPVILFLGRLDPRKGLPVLIKAFPIIKEEFPHLKLLVVGKGDIPEDITEDLLDSIIFTGKVSNDMVPVFYRSSDLYCSPALGGETFGIVLLEAMASGTPVIASDIEGYREVIPDEVMMFGRNDPESLAERAISVLKNKVLRERIIELGVETARKYDWMIVAKKTEDFYKELIKDYN